MMSNDDEMCAKILEVILFKIHSIQETFFEHKISPSVRNTTDYGSKFRDISHLAFFVELRLRRSEKRGFPLYRLITCTCKHVLFNTKGRPFEWLWP